MKCVQEKKREEIIDGENLRIEGTPIRMELTDAINALCRGIAISPEKIKITRIAISQNQKQGAYITGVRVLNRSYHFGIPDPEVIYPLDFFKADVDALKRIERHLGREVNCFITKDLSRFYISFGECVIKEYS